MAWDLKDHQLPVSGPNAGLPTTRSSTRPVAQGLIQPGLEHPQDRAFTTSLGSLFPVPYHYLSKNFPPDIQSKCSLLLLKITTLCPITIYPCKKLISLIYNPPPNIGRL